MTDPQTVELDSRQSSPESRKSRDEHPQKLFGICQAVGEAVGVKPIFIRIALLILLMFSPLAMMAAYATLGAFVLGSQILFPDVQPEPAIVAANVAAAEPEILEERERLAA